MSKNGRYVKSRYNDDGLRVIRDRPHSDKLNEKHLRSKLHSKSFDYDEDDNDDLHWLYQEDDD